MRWQRKKKVGGEKLPQPVAIEMDYSVYNEILAILLKQEHYALINAEYKNETGYFTFFDSKYIPDIMLEGRSEILGNKQAVQKADKEIRGYLQKYIGQAKMEVGIWKKKEGKKENESKRL